MITCRWNDNWNKVNTREELVELLKKYKGILSSPMIDYLNSLIELEFSVIKEYIGEVDRKSLAELEIYKRIAIYNIYNRALNLLSENNIQYDFSGNNHGNEYLTIYVPSNDNNRIKVFDFNYGDDRLNKWDGPRIPDEYKNMKIETISLYQSLESQKLREAELNRVMNKLEGLYTDHNPYPSRRYIVGGPGSQWEFEHTQEITRIREIIY